jgi:RsiW-degrading membrane proteinase PrsW (M82 family)
MPISFSCTCGNRLQVDQSRAGRQMECPDCGAILVIPHQTEAEAPAAIAADPAPTSESVLFRPSQQLDSYRAGQSQAATIREYAYLLLGFALIPLIFSLLGKRENTPIRERVEATLEKATPSQIKRAEELFSKNVPVSKEELLGVMPDGKLLGAHLPHDTAMHWVYAGIAAMGFLVLLLFIFSIERVNPLHLVGVGLFTGTVGIVFLLIVQYCSQFRLGTIPVRGRAAIVFLILALIGWSYRSALDPDTNFFLSALGFTFGVGLCEEATKALPLRFYFEGYGRIAGNAARSWRGACLWGLASGVGFGISEGVMYSGDSYNGVSGADIYIVRFVSCVALHAMWSGAIAIAIARRLEYRKRDPSIEEFDGSLFGVLVVPIALHGFYDTLLKRDLQVWALLIAILSFVWLVVQIERARLAGPEAGSWRSSKLQPA